MAQRERPVQNIFRFIQGHLPLSQHFWANLTTAHPCSYSCTNLSHQLQLLMPREVTVHVPGFPLPSPTMPESIPDPLLQMATPQGSDPALLFTCMLLPKTWLLDLCVPIVNEVGTWTGQWCIHENPVPQNPLLFIPVTLTTSSNGAQKQTQTAEQVLWG